MCGIAGISVKAGCTVPGLVERVRAMSQRMIHRGPDDEGLFVSPDGMTVFANRRLAIQDLSSAGHMPMCNAAASVVITYNGELYNAGEIRPDLERLGFGFKSHSDTEVILHGYEAWGTAVFSRLRGIFALAL